MKDSSMTGEEEEVKNRLGSRISLKRDSDSGSTFGSQDLAQIYVSRELDF